MINAGYAVILASQLMRNINQTPAGEAFSSTDPSFPWLSCLSCNKHWKKLRANYWIKVQVAKVLLTYS